MKNIYFILASLVIISCTEKVEYPEVTIIPSHLTKPIEYRAYTTNDAKEVIGQIPTFKRELAGKDTIDGRAVYVFHSQDQEYPFYRDEDGTVYQKNTAIAGLRVIPYGFTFKGKPFEFSYWQTMMKTKDGLDSRWSTQIDTVFTAYTSENELQKIRYIYDGKAKFNGWTTTFMPTEKKNIEVLDAYWYELNEFFINETTGDTLFSSIGDGHHFFTEQDGGVKYIRNYKLREIGDAEYINRYSTWEQLSSLSIN